MWYRKSIILAFATGFSLRLLADPASPDESAQVARPLKTAINATVQVGEVIGQEQQRRVLATADGRRLILTVPLGFRVDISNPEKVVLVNSDYSCVLSFRIAAPGTATAASLNAEVCRAWLSARLGDLRIQEEFSMATAGGSGPAYDLLCKVDGVARASRVAFIATSVGVVEFTSLSSPGQSEAAKAKLRFLLRSFQISNADGKLDLPPSKTAS
jgi:hypothetical protein